MTFEKSVSPQTGPYLTAPDPQQTLACQVCGARPAKSTIFHSYLGLLVLLFDRKTKGVFCKQCGTAAQRDASARSMTRGWWSLHGVLWVPFGLFLNYLRQRSLDRLDDPRGAVAAPLVPGPKAYQRVGPLVTSLVVGVLVGGFLLLIVYVVIASPPAE